MFKWLFNINNLEKLFNVGLIIIKGIRAIKDVMASNAQPAQ